MEEVQDQEIEKDTTIKINTNLIKINNMIRLIKNFKSHKANIKVNNKSNMYLYLFICHNLIKINN